MKKVTYFVIGILLFLSLACSRGQDLTSAFSGGGSAPVEEAPEQTEEAEETEEAPKCPKEERVFVSDEHLNDFQGIYEFRRIWSADGGGKVCPADYTAAMAALDRHLACNTNPGDPTRVPDADGDVSNGALTCIFGAD